MKAQLALLVALVRSEITTQKRYVSMVLVLGARQASANALTGSAVKSLRVSREIVAPLLSTVTR